MPITRCAGPEVFFFFFNFPWRKRKRAAKRRQLVETCYRRFADRSLFREEKILKKNPLDQGNYASLFAMKLEKQKLNYTHRLMIFRTIYSVRGCLHYTGATFAPEWVHSNSLSWLYICLHDTTTKCHASASSPRLLYRGENFTPVRNLATVYVNAKRAHVSVWSRSAGRLERVAHA